MKKLMITFVCVIVGVFVVIPVILVLTQRKSWEGTFVYYGERLISYNEEFTGSIDEEDKKVVIRNQSGEEISHLETSTIPNQIALGENYYYVLYYQAKDSRDSKIVQYDYQSNKIKECAIDNIATIACKGGYLFLGEWSNEDYYFAKYADGFYASRYIEEERFGNEPEKIVLDNKGQCILGDTEMYFFHNEGFFSTEPLLEDYPGVSTGYFTGSDKDSHFQAKSKREGKNRELLMHMMQMMEEKMNRRNDNFFVCEYQSGNYIYGVCNELEALVPECPMKSADVQESYAYRIDAANDEITIMAQMDSALALVTSETEFVFQKDRSIMQQNLETGEEKELYKIRDTGTVHIGVTGNYLLIVEKNKCIPIRWTAEK